MGKSALFRRRVARKSLEPGAPPAGGSGEGAAGAGSVQIKIALPCQMGRRRTFPPRPFIILGRLIPRAARPSRRSHSACLASLERLAISASTSKGNRDEAGVGRKPFCAKGCASR